VKKAESPDFLLSVANHPRNRAYTGAAWSEYDPARWDHTLGLEWSDGGVVFEQLKSGVWEAHWVFLPKARNAVAKGREALAYLFTHTDARKVIGKTPSKWRHAKRAASRVGMRLLFECRGFSFTELTRQQWLTDKEV
jgi:hypothetical protein